MSDNSKSQAGDSNQNDTMPSKYSVVKDGWGDRPSFQHSYGLKMDPDGIEEGNAILDAMMEQDYGAQSDEEESDDSDESETAEEEDTEGAEADEQDYDDADDIDEADVEDSDMENDSDY